MVDYTDPKTQASMILDRVRTSAYERAIREMVREGDVVMDVGSGSGILALFAASAGARKVYAVESTDAAEFAREHAWENGFEDIIEVIQADIGDLNATTIKEPPRVIVSEMLGNFAPGEDQHRIYQQAKAMAQPGAVLIPACYRMLYAAAHPQVFEGKYATLENVQGISLNFLLSQILSQVSYEWLYPEDLCGPEVAGPDIATDSDLPEAFMSSVPIEKDGPVSAIAISFTATLTSSIHLGSSIEVASESWPQTIFPIYPEIFCHRGDILEIEIRPLDIMRKETWAWSLNKDGQIWVYGAPQNWPEKKLLNRQF